MTQMRAEIVQDWSRFSSLEAEWNGLLRRSNANTIFLTWEWIRSWIDVVGTFVQPLVIIVRDTDGALVGLVPSYVTRLYLGGLIPYRTLRPMADYATGAEYPDWIVSKDHEAEATQAIAGLLEALPNHWDCLWMPNVSGWTGARERILRVCEERRFFCHVRPRDFALLELPGDMKAYTEALSMKKRQNLRQEMKKIMGRSGVAITRCETPEQLPRFLEALFDLHYRRWKPKGQEGTFRRKPSEARFYRQFTAAALARGWLRLFALEDHGEFKAIQIGYVYDNVFHVMQEGFDPEYIAGVGNVLRANVIEACITEGLKAMDFLGEVSWHKTRWLAKQRTGYDLFIGRKSFKNRLLFCREVWPTGRFLRQLVFPGAMDVERRRSEPTAA